MDLKSYSTCLFPSCLLAIMIYSGCSSQYIEKDFDSKASYYSKINKSLDGRNAEIYFMNGEEMKGEKINIKNDSLFWQSEFTKKLHASTSLKLIKGINYTSYKSLSPVNFNGSIKLNIDSVINLSNAVFIKDTLSYNYVGTYEKNLLNQKVKLIYFLTATI